MLEKIERGNKKKAAAKSKVSGGHPDHSIHKGRIGRVRGQLNAIERMIDEREYCPNIVYQIRAAAAALKSLESEIMKTHLRGCVRTAFSSKDPFEVDSKIQEILKLIE